MTTITKQRRALSQRLQHMRRRVIDAPRELGIVRVREVTNAIRNNRDLPRIIQFALGVRETLKKLPIDISDSELIVGKSTEKFKGSALYPELKSDGLIKELDNFNERTSMQFKLTDEEKRELREDILPFWDGTSGFDKWAKQLDKDTDFLVRNLAIIPFNDFQGSTGLSYVDYRKVLENGYEGIIGEAQARLAGVSNGGPEAEDKRAFYKAVIIAAEGVIELAKRHSRLASEMARTAPSEERAKELREIAEICAQVPAKPARTFREAVQSFWFTFCGLQQMDMPMELPGARIDQYLYPFYRRDVKEGRLSREDAQEFIDELFVRFNQVVFLGEYVITRVVDGNSTRFDLTLGGVDRDGKDATNELSYVFLDAADAVRLLHPSVTIRLHPDTPESFFQAVGEVMTNGSNVVQVFNDNVIVESFTRVGVPVEDARDYVLTGCIQPLSGNMYGPSCSVFFNGPKILEMFLNGGKPILSLAGDDADMPSPEYESWEDFYAAFKDYYRSVLERAFSQYRLVGDIQRRDLPNPVLSPLVPGSLERGKDVKAGGALNNASGIALVGNGTLIDSLAAIRDVVYTKKSHTLDEVVGWLKTDFEYNEEERQALRNHAPKFGTCDSRADEIAKDLVDFTDELLLSQPKTSRGGAHVLSMHTEAHHIYQGSMVAASADGRHAGEAMSPGCGPTSGMDKEGPTASMQSVCAMDFTKMAGGSSYNQRYSPKMFDTEQGVQAFISLLKAYFFKLGGQHLQISTVDTETLRDAQKNPAKYEDLLVRVTGYSARFVELTEATQEEIIARSEICGC
ncbi:hypothetical protein HZA56_20630 [Candidatus Poribacteria bacterium]|nr:hypothetical protein [Candidatus Poribacteria bacterium]